MNTVRRIRGRCQATLLLAVFALYAGTAQAGANRWTSVGPGSAAIVTALASDASSADILYAGTAGGGVFKSVDGGDSWTAVNQGLDDGGVESLSVDPSTPGAAYAATGLGGVFRTNDGGKTWSLAHRSDDVFVSLAVDPARPSRIYAEGISGGLYLSNDRGGSWVATGARVWPVAQTLAVCRDSTVYAVLDTLTAGDQPSRSTDGGATWIPLRAGTFENTATFACDPSDPQTVYVALDQVLSKSSDGGQTWRSLTTNATLITTIAVSPADPKMFAFGTRDGSVYQSLDAGATYGGSAPSALGPSDAGGIRTLLVGGTSPAILAARGNSLMKGLFGSAPAWHTSTQGLDAAGLGALAVERSNPALLLSAEGSAPMRSSDGGTTWVTGDSGGAALSNIFFSPSDPSVALAGNDQGIYRTADGGTTWRRASSASSALGFAYPPDSTTTAYAATSAGVQKSTDGGNTWRRTGGSQSPSYAVLADTLGSGILYATWGLSSSPPVFYYGYDQLTVEKSTDGGQTWNKSDTGLPQDKYLKGPGVSALAMDPSHSSTLYAGTQNNGVYRSTDGAATWAPANNGIETLSVGALLVDPAHPSTLYLSSGSGVYRSGDGGSSWAPFNDGLGNLAVSALSIDSTGQHLFASTFGGGAFAMDIQPPPSSCADDEDHACYLGRFLVSASARPPLGNLPPQPVPVRQGDRFGSFRLGADETMASDIFLKIVDGRSLPGHAFWIFHAGLTHDAYAVTVTDTVTGQARVYQNGADRLGCGGIDTYAFPDPGMAGVQDARGSTLTAGSGDTLTLFGGRFAVTVSATDPRSGRKAPGLAMAQDDQNGYFSLPDFTNDPAFPEVFVRVSQSPDGLLSFEHMGLTDLRYVLTVTDSSGGTVTTYRNDTTDDLHPCGGSAVLGQ